VNEGGGGRESRKEVEEGRKEKGTRRKGMGSLYIFQLTKRLAW
jgi:hypothetical protein